MAFYTIFPSLSETGGVCLMLPISNIIPMNIYSDAERISALYDLYIKGNNPVLKDKNYSKLTLTERALIQKGQDAHVTLLDIFSKYFSNSCAYTLKNKTN